MSRHDLDLDRTMPNVELVRAIFTYYQCVQVSSGLKCYFLSYPVHRKTHTHTHTYTHTHTHTQTDTQTDMITL